MQYSFNQMDSHLYPGGKQAGFEETIPRRWDGLMQSPRGRRHASHEASDDYPGSQTWLFLSCPELCNLAINPG